MILGFTINSVKANNKDLKGVQKVNINSIPNVLDIEKITLPEVNEALCVKFSFVTKYEPVMGEIILEGSLLWKGEKQADVIKLWGDNKKLETDAGIEILNAVFQRCLPRTINLAEELRLPPPIQFPKVVAGEPTESAKAT
jgi:hypothetical protein